MKWPELGTGKLLLWKKQKAPGDTTEERAQEQRRVELNAFRNVHGDAVDDAAAPTYEFHPNNAAFASNFVSSTRYKFWSFPFLFFREQFKRVSNCYFLVLAILSVIPIFQLVEGAASLGLLITLAVVLGVSALREIVEDASRAREDRRLNNSPTAIVRDPSDAETKPDTTWADVRVGDVVKLRNRDHVPADMVILSTSSSDGVIFIETKNLDGESNLKRKMCNKQVASTFSNPSDILTRRAYIECEAPNDRLYQFSGSMVFEQQHPEDASKPAEWARLTLTQDHIVIRGTSIRNTDWVYGLVVYTGSETKLLQNQKPAQIKVSRVEASVNRIILVPIVLEVCIVILFTILWSTQCTSNPAEDWYLTGFGSTFVQTGNCGVGEGFVVFVKYILIFSYMVPIQLFVLLEIARVFQQLFIQADFKMRYDGQNMQVRSAALNEELGMVHYVFSDKTGTLTSNEMILRRVSLRNGRIFSVAQQGAEEEAQPALLTGDDGATVPMPTLRSLVDSLMQKDRSCVFDVDATTGAEEATMAYGAEFLKVLSLCHTVVPESSLSTGNEKEDENDVKRNGSRTGSGNLLHTLASRGVRFGGVTNDGATLPTEGAAAATEEASSSVANDRSDAAVPDSTLVDMDANVSGAGAAGASGPVAYQSSSPDEVALVVEAANHEFEFVHRTNEFMRVSVGKQNYDWELLGVIEFSSARKRMSVVVREPSDEPWTLSCKPLSQEAQVSAGPAVPSGRKVRMYCKGADSIMLSRVAEQEKQAAQQMMLTVDEFAACGYRTLVMAYRDLDEDYFSAWLDRLAMCNALPSGEDKEAQILALEEEIERDFLLIGCSAIEDKLQDGVSETLARMKQAGIKTWVLTGDKQGTAINIGMGCGLMDESYEVTLINETDEDYTAAQIEKTLGVWRARLLLHKEHVESDRVRRRDSNQKAESTTQHIKQQFFMDSDKVVERDAVIDPGKEGRNKFALVMDGHTLEFAAREHIQEKFVELGSLANTVVLCRVSPKQKAEVVEMVRQWMPDSVTLAVGDGANDVGMIQAAHVGVGIRGKEGVEAVLASDFCIGQFRFLQRLMLVHGRWCYKRLIKLVYATMYSAMLVASMDFYNGFFIQFSGQPLMDPLLLGLYTIVFTPLPLLILAIWDHDAPQEYSLMFPELYRKSQQRTHLRFGNYLAWIAMAIAQTCLIYFCLYSNFGNSTQAGLNLGVESLGILGLACIIFTFHLFTALQVGAWNVWMFLIWVVSGTSYLWVILVYTTPFIANGLNPPYVLVGIDTWNASFSWLSMFIIPVICVLPAFTRKAVRKIMYPRTKDLIIELSRKGIRRESFDPSVVPPTEPRKLPRFIQRDADIKPAEVKLFSEQHDTFRREVLRGEFVPQYEAKKFQALKRHGSEGDINEVVDLVPEEAPRLAPALPLPPQDQQHPKKPRHMRNKSDGVILKNRPKFDDMV
ncbi:putative phospholipid-transporting ATPase VD [Porphyridium purpureum]|uniref:Phospholipid-transporting ATPase n=1 Tax=Porphyridium purpureum TaxID=35688 RepID=A0A5J4YNJ7_PORPP|nr:putative phospholipid-transporting ATPase VD [Porphyridium purpureum]|eukprot:POR4858..scf295_9